MKMIPVKICSPGSTCSQFVAYLTEAFSVSSTDLSYCNRQFYNYQNFHNANREASSYPPCCCTNFDISIRHLG
uniref:Spaetzle domain-containing protein n=1 Tax=Mesocestoides corti TaxID=53468 RepID=A0A5K3FZB5_MESCO